MNWLFTAAIFVVAILFLGSVFGPRETVDWSIWVSADELGDDLDAYLETSERRVAGIKPGTEKRIVWAGQKGAKTALSIVYIHGFSASNQEIAPVPEQLAAQLGANLYLTRLTGHGRSGAALANATANDWINDTVEALEIGSKLGERTIVIAASTGGTLAIAMAAYPEYSVDIAGLVLVAPNLELAQSGSWLLGKPFARLYVPMMIGHTLSWQPHNEEHAKWWTYSYPVEAVFQMAALVSEVRSFDHADQQVPAFFVYSPADQVVKASATQAVAAEWGGPVRIWEIEAGDGLDPSAHIMTGDILSPANTAEFVSRVTEWISGL